MLVLGVILKTTVAGQATIIIASTQGETTMCQHLRSVRLTGTVLGMGGNVLMVCVAVSISQLSFLVSYFVVEGKVLMLWCRHERFASCAVSEERRY